MSEKRFKKRWLLLALLLFIGPPMALNGFGFCFKEKRWLSKREIVDKMLLSEKVHIMNADEKKLAIKNKNIGEYANNCRITAVGTGLYSLSYYDVDCVSPHYSEKNLYYYRVYAVDSCGKSLDYFGDTIKEDSYKIQLKRNEEYWKGK